MVAVLKTALKLLAYSSDHVTSYIEDSKKELLRRGGFIVVALTNIWGVVDIYFFQNEAFFVHSI